MRGGDSGDDAGMKHDLNAVVTQRIEVAPGLMIIRIVPDGWELPEFKPGQFAVLGLPASAPRHPASDTDLQSEVNGKLIRRAYSIASSSADRNLLEFYVTLVQSGALTPRLFALNPGDRLWLGPKISGAFTLDQAPSDKHVVLVATGTGLAPYMSMMRTLLSQDATRSFVVILGARHSWDLGYHAELVTMERLSQNFTYLPIISRPEEEPIAWSGETGYVMDVFRSGQVEDALNGPIAPKNDSVFLCGNPAMIEDMCSLLTDQGLKEHSRKTPGEIFVERYW